MVLSNGPLVSSQATFHHVRFQTTHPEVRNTKMPNTAIAADGVESTYRHVCRCSYKSFSDRIDELAANPEIRNLDASSTIDQNITWFDIWS